MNMVTVTVLESSVCYEYDKLWRLHCTDCGFSAEKTIECHFSLEGILPIILSIENIVCFVMQQQSHSN